MKKIVIIILLSLYFVNAKAQAWIYHPMPESNAVWRVDRYSTNCNPPFGLYSSLQLVIGGDTIIGSYTYKKVYRSGMEDLCGATPYFGNTYGAFIRNDSINKKVYSIGYLSYPDTLVYDYSLNVGDPVISLLSVSGTFVNSIDSIVIGGGGYRKRFNLNNGYSYIEEIGSSNGLLGALYPLPDDNLDLICYTHNSEIYPSTTTSCPLIMNTVNINDLNLNEINVKISPNPSNGVFEIKSSNYPIQEIILYNIFGEKIYYSNTISIQMELNICNESQGIYLVKIMTTDYNIFNMRFIKN